MADKPRPPHANNEQEAPLDDEVADQLSERLGAKLREEYADLLRAPVPDRFTQLLDQLAATPAGAPSPGTSADADVSDADTAKRNHNGDVHER